VPGDGSVRSAHSATLHRGRVGLLLGMDVQRRRQQRRVPLHRSNRGAQRRRHENARLSPTELKAIRSTVRKNRAFPRRFLPQRTQRTQREELKTFLLCDLCVLCGSILFGFGWPRCAIRGSIPFGCGGPRCKLRLRITEFAPRDAPRLQALETEQRPPHELTTSLAEPVPKQRQKVQITRTDTCMHED